MYNKREYAEWIERELHSFGLQTFLHHYDCISDNKTQSTCINVIAELRAQRTSGKEAILLTTPFIEEMYGLFLMHCVFSFINHLVI